MNEYRIHNKKFSTQGGVRMFPTFVYGETPGISIAFEPGQEHQQGDEYFFVIDDDLRFHDFDETDEFAGQVFGYVGKEGINVAPDGTSVSFEIDLHTAKFRERINGNKGLAVWVQLSRKRSGKYDVLLMDRSQAGGVVFDSDGYVPPCIPEIEYGDITWDTLPGKPSAFPPTAHTHTTKDITDFPEIPDVGDFTWDTLPGKPSAFPPSEHSHSKDDITDFPEIPDVGDGTITITQGGVNKGSFTLNQKGDATIALDAGGGGTVTQVQSDWSQTDASQPDYIKNKPTVMDGEDGEDGKSAYQIWLDAGNVGSVDDFLASLQGEQGPQGVQGEQGPQGEKGQDGQNGQDGYSPTATVTKVSDTTTITITDKNGTTSATVKDGTNVDLTQYATTAYVDQRIGELETALTETDALIDDILNE